METHRLGPGGSLRVDVPSHKDRPGDGVQCGEQVGVPHIPCMEDERGLMIGKERKEGGMRPAVRVGHNSNPASLRAGEVDAFRLVLQGHCFKLTQ